MSVTGRYRSGQTDLAVNQVAHAFEGSNPSLPMYYFKSEDGKKDSKRALVMSSDEEEDRIGRVADLERTK